jgi:hypothetical protein
MTGLNIPIAERKGIGIWIRREGGGEELHTGALGYHNNK